jgi:hypothetical protein
VDPKGIIYVADRENGRIQRFDPKGKFLSEWSGYGKTFSITWRGGAIWIGTQPRDQLNGAPGWIMKLDPASGKLLGWVASTGHHSVEATDQGEVFTGSRPNRLLWFR